MANPAPPAVPMHLAETGVVGVANSGANFCCSSISLGSICNIVALKLKRLANGLNGVVWLSTPKVRLGGGVDG